MYLKSIEVQGFKSFANKIIFDFHNGITGIVGPNGSGKSNVADAVRWVLGEQSAKQLRGSKMEDIIFAGTETRKPVGYAYVSITLDNSDHALQVEYDEVIVTRRVFRSGESEYLLNGHNCRLKDINELFYDTGIGKEGYSIIGQGQIDKILSGKPDERRELFDEAAGIVKFKRRKETAQKKLENEKANLVRVNDIFMELEKQVGPLEKQSEKAREYLKLKDNLKVYDVNSFLLESDRIKTVLAELNIKLEIANTDLNSANSSYENTKSEYEQAELQLSQINNDIETTASLQSDSELAKGRLEGQINVLNEQIKTIQVNDKHFSERISSINDDIAKRIENNQKFTEEKAEITKKLQEINEKEDTANRFRNTIVATIEELTKNIESNKDEIFEILNEKSSVKAKNQRYQTMLEQINIRKSELNSKIITGKSEEGSQNIIIKDLINDLNQVNNDIKDLTVIIKDYDDKVIQIKSEITELLATIDKKQQQYHKDLSTLESLRNITERYDGYGNSIRKIMELKSSKPGILGVIADIVKVEKKYEVAIETALGGTIQNIVTDNEQTAKNLIEYLKVNKFGRATFLPLASISNKNTLEKDACIKEPGVIGIASNLVKVSFEYENLAKYLLGRVLVVDNINNALMIAKKYKYSLKIVTLEGEQLNPGGSMTGGAFKNSSNLLGRRREIEELKVSVVAITKSIEEQKAILADNKKTVSEIREQLDINNKRLREKQLSKNTIEMNYKQAIIKKDEIIASYSDSANEVAEIDRQNEEINGNLLAVNNDMQALDSKTSDTEFTINDLSAQLELEKSNESKHSSSVEAIHIEYSELAQKNSFVQENMNRIDLEIMELHDEITELQSRMGETGNEITEKNKSIETIQLTINDAQKQITECIEKTILFKTQRDKVQNSHKAFFDKRETLSQQISNLDKECFRLNSQKEKLDETYEFQIDYMWNEYEITFSLAAKLRDENLTDLSEIKKMINQLKNTIKSLGDVNVNSIEEYKNVSERYEFLKKQQDDLVEAENTLLKIIEELDTGMRIQFESKFNEIKDEFDKVFKELFGGGRGTIELVEGEDILEAGITIVSQPPGKKLQNMMQLSGGEKSLTAISLLFAIQNLKPSPFCLLDEIEAALDDSNVARYANYLHKLTKHTQFIVITHRRGTMAAADRLYGITMQEKGISTLVSVDLIVDDLDKADSKKD
ncbi:chromosome segregation protein SMC [[Clostridium] fimetarium]|uniref:Chromosome partition protein Smc n=1 Tax=[Clostridium] fimetarium TaxID=99656 RepID=A0A1I0RIK6_9FIRM|nr:chromosome segregation protein SMC [[Clostridium] fimetarium]SEW40767.1 condensin subunit Smc [[Clostridium] fimetarium]